MIEYENPWIFNGEPFSDIASWAGFVYLIEDTVSGRKYLGKKFFWNHRKLPGKTRRSKVESNWKKYYGSNDELKKLVKENGGNRFRRYILSLHSLERDVNYEEVKMQFLLGVLEDESSQWFNENINGKWQKYLVKGIEERSRFSQIQVSAQASEHAEEPQ